MRKHSLFSKPLLSLTAILLASAAILPMMGTAIYVHLQPNVPAEVLPLKIKPPFIPVFFLLLALTNIYLIQRKTKDTN